MDGKFQTAHTKEESTMTILTNTTDRKALVKAIAEELHTEARYLRTPTYAYEIGEFTVDRYGNIIGDDFTPLMAFLLRNGYITEDATAHTENTDAPAEEEAPAEEPAAEPVEKDTTEEPDTDTTDSEEDEQPAGDSSDGRQRITIPAPDITVEQLRNLTYTLYSRQYILNLMTGGDTICIPQELVEALKEALPATPEDFTRLLNSHKALGLKGFNFEAGQFSMTFPFYEAEPTKWTTFAGLQGRILQAALAATRVFPELIQPEEEAEKYTAHIWLQRMGYKGPGMKEQRNILLKHLHGYCAFSNGAKMQNHKDKYAAIRRERREAERAAAQTAPETIAPT
ncbi:MAG: hypothetical protein IJY72_05045, partial [Akkermansia sp.]|nr:hypothetical protein [Akkermansia sp.]